MNLRIHQGLLVAVVIMPVLYLPGFGNWVREPKQALLLFTAGILGIALLQAQSLRNVSKLSAICTLSWLSIITLQILSLIVSDKSQINPGAFLLAVGSSASVVLIALSVLKLVGPFPQLITQYRLALALGATMTAAFASLEVYWGFSPWDRALFQGLPLGGRNYLPIFLALCFPVLANGAFKKEQSRLGLALSFLWVAWLVTLAIVFRTRTAGLIIGLQLVLMGIRAARGGFRGGPSRLAGLSLAAVLVAVACLNLLPTHLNWKSEPAKSDSTVLDKRTAFFNGRNQLWPIVIESILDSPGFGIGAGQFPPRARLLISRTNTSADPQVFSFMTKDAPAFNDYLQQYAELGLVGGSVFLWAYLGIPLLLVILLILRKEKSDLVFAMAFSCLSAGVGALFTNSFDRPEQLLIHGSHLGFILSTLGEPSDLASPSGLINLSIDRFRWVIGGFALGCLAIVICFSGRYFLLPTPLRSFPSWKSSPLTQVAWAYRLWPWDLSWNEGASSWIWDRWTSERPTESKRWIQAFMEDRQTYWPSHPDVWFQKVLYFDRLRDERAALDAFRLALVELPRGRCRASLFRDFVHFCRARGISPATALAEGPSSHCAELLDSSPRPTN